MKSPFRLPFMTAILLLLFSCHEENTVIPEINGDSALKKVTEIYEIGPRSSGSEGARKTADFIINEIKKYGLSPETDQWVEKTPSDSETTFRNVTTVIPGKTKDYMIIGSHYDTKKLESVPEFAGANDGASSTGLLLSLIKAVKDNPTTPPVTVEFAFFDGEECICQYNDNDGLFGSRRMASKLKVARNAPTCRAVIILDMIGDKDLNISLSSNSDPVLTDNIIKIAGERNWKKYFTRSNANIIDDHTPFHKLGIPAVDIIDFEYGENNRYWHTRADTIDKISQDSLKIVGDLVISLIYNRK